MREIMRRITPASRNAKERLQEEEEELFPRGESRDGPAVARQREEGEEKARRT